ncbi:MAG: Asp-tRNA(Asn)/Glu-tRNA(Gln) amidotransferase subunit GatC [Clostridiales bacterium]|nr:Asp-tRNA(Asn)/Glu-tRNA(Gln) amidotransferase subunit GatC [Clostridiales bacterium]
MQVSREEILRIAQLANLKIDDEEIEKYILNLQDILNYANIVNKVDVSGLNETIGANDNYNVFRKDEIKEFKNRDGLLQNAPEQERGMFKIPKVLN